MRAARPVLVIAERLDASADMVVEQLNQRDVAVMRFESADFPQHITLTAGHRPTAAGWEGVLTDEHRSVRLEDVRAVYYRRPGRPVIAGTVAEPYATWAQNQADAAMLNCPPCPSAGSTTLTTTASPRTSHSSSSRPPARACGYRTA